MIEIQLGNELFVPRPNGSGGRALLDDSKPDDADDDQVDRHDVIEQPRHDQNENAGDEGNDGRQMADAESHGSQLLDETNPSAGNDGGRRAIRRWVWKR